MVALSSWWHKETHPVGIEPTTYALGVRCSIQLSYGCTVLVSELHYYSKKNRDFHPALIKGEGMYESLSLTEEL